jgi:UDP-N-acetylglucosamine acyltransferase
MTNTNIHPTAIIHPKAKLGKNISIGPYCIVGEHAQLGDAVQLLSHVVVDGHTTIGAGSKIFPFASIGTIPQDLKYAGEESKVEIGSNTTIREYVTINPGTSGGGLLTKVGNHCLLMVGSHVAHDCIVGDHVIMANNATLAGHVYVGDYAVIGGLSAIHQFVRVGHHAMIGGMSGIENDVIPYGQAMGERATLVGLNLIGLKRRQFNREDIHILRTTYRLLFSPEGTLQERVDDAREMFPQHKAVLEILNFITSSTSRAICQPKSSGHTHDETTQ